MIDVIHQINSVRRQVGTRVLEAGQARGKIGQPISTRTYSCSTETA